MEWFQIFETERLQIFEAVDKETHEFSSGNSFTISTVFEESGTFEIVISGTGGAWYARRGIERVAKIIDES